MTMIGLFVYRKRRVSRNKWKMGDFGGKVMYYCYKYTEVGEHSISACCLPIMGKEIEVKTQCTRRKQTAREIIWIVVSRVLLSVETSAYYQSSPFEAVVIEVGDVGEYDGDVGEIGLYEGDVGEY